MLPSASARPGLLAGLTLPRVLLALGLIGVFVITARPQFDTDTWWHLRTGTWILSHGQIPAVDIFSHTMAGAPWRIPGWPAQVALAWVYQQAGALGVNLAVAVLVTVTFGFLAAISPGNPFIRAAALIFGAVTASVYIAARPALFTLVFSAVTLWLLGGSSRRAWGLVPLLAVWANVHGGFALGFILMGLVSLGRVVQAASEASTGAGRVRAAWAAGRGLLAIGLAGVAAACLNPYGPEMLLYPFKTVGIEVLRAYIAEWQPPDLQATSGQLYLGLVSLTYWVMLAARRRPGWAEMVPFVGATTLGFLAVRNVPIGVLVATPLLIRYGSAALGEAAAQLGMGAGRPALNAMVLVVLVLGALVRIAQIAPEAYHRAQLVAVTPFGAVDFIARTRPAGPLFNSYNFGGYLTWALYPEYPVFIDGRTDVYSPTVLADYLDLSAGGPGAVQTLTDYGINLVLVETGSPLAAQLAVDAGWQQLYGDETAVVFARRVAE